ncbi:putative LysM domain protein [Aspergillus mulundensis]|uniref:LysM protein n=1 Tax=Aspergillus mulundensis TaxID=1810919 RepID=A0A3D8QN15_9EURO|nr:LysM protein [Aspergillus mulundensis]RDW63078.1 LysM protein [Aspergillus mulundensis]
MLYSTPQRLGLALLGLELSTATPLSKRFSNGDFATGETDPDVSTACTYWANSISSSDTCADLESYYGLTIAQLVSWNPSLSSTECTLNEGWSYCVESTDAVKPITTTSTTSKTTATVTTTTAASTSTTATASATTTSSASSPSPTQTGLISSCNAYYYVEKGDYCQGIVDSFANFTLPQFYAWNPAVQDDCSGLQAGYYVCVGVTGSSEPSATSTTLTTTTKESSTAVPTSTSPYEPQQTGLASNCTRALQLTTPANRRNCCAVGNEYYFVESGDTCAEIASDNSIALSSFYAWNPAVGSSCSGLQAGYYVCVGVAGTTSTSTSTATTTTKSPSTTASTTTGTGTATAPSPTQSGLTPSCTTYYKAVSGDSCWSITNEKYSYLAGTSLFYDWNPAVGSDCANLQAGYYYCVATEDQGPMPDTDSSCSAWHLVASGDSCWSIEQEYGVSAADFGEWNPYVGEECKALWLGYFVCVGA